jgi:DUF4097 and DUF4098 domain-containing protein YvlB
MRTIARDSFLALTPLAALAAAGCSTGFSSATSTFDRDFTVSGPLNLELSNGSGDARITRGGPGQVHIHGEIRVRSVLGGSIQNRLSEIAQNPPVQQDGNLIRVGDEARELRNVQINYTIVVPGETELRGRTGSGNIEVHDIRGPVDMTAGSGDLTAEGIDREVKGTCGSGSIRMNRIHGDAQATAGSGDIHLLSVQGEVRTQTGSGDVRIEKPSGPVTAGAGSGDISITGASADLQLHTGSGELQVEGNPAPKSYWELHTSSGGVGLQVPSSASFRLVARSSSGRIQTSIPIVIEEQTSKHELRARVGDGGARVEVETSSGEITLH